VLPPLNTDISRGIAADAARQRHIVVATLGLIQILAWGSTYYLPAVLAKPISLETGWPLGWVVGGLSIGLLVAGFVSPKVGRAIHERGGRPVLALSSAIFALGLVTATMATSLPVFLATWSVLGLAMAMGLYDAVFATLGGLYGSSARTSITAVTIFAGFAGTVSWPFSAALVEIVGWRGTCLVYAGLHLILALPAHLLFIPRSSLNHIAQAEVSQSNHANVDSYLSGVEASSQERQLVLFLMIATSLTIGAAITSVITVHLLSILEDRGRTLSAAVTLGTLIGPSQVGARVYEITLGRRFHPTWTLLTSGCLMACGVAVLRMAFPLVAVGLILYGAGVGIMTIAKGTLPLAVFGASRYAIIMGRLALPSLLAQAIAPAAAAFLLARRAGTSEVLTILVCAGVLNVILILTLRFTSQSQIRVGQTVNA
jgi:Major Facilitator Superfamily